VERAWRDDPDVATPVEGALVTVTAPDGESFSSMTDSKGRALIELHPSGSNEIASYHITASKAGMMLHPDYSDGINQIINRYSTPTVVLQMEEPVSIVLSLNRPHYGGKVTLSGGNQPGGKPLEVDLSPEATQVRFDNLWPVSEVGNISGYYAINASLKIYHNDLADQSAFVRWEEDDPVNSIYNRWTYDQEDKCWITGPADSIPEHNRLGLAIENLNQFLPGNGFQLAQDGVDQILLGAENFTIEPGTESNDYELIFKSHAEVPLADLIKSSENWQVVSTLQQALDAVASSSDSQEIRLTAEDLHTSLKLRFDTSADIEEIVFGPLFIQANYHNPKISFTEPGQTLVLPVFADSK